MFDAQLSVTIDPSGDIRWLAGHLVPDAELPAMAATLTSTDAARIVGGSASTAVLGFVDPEILGETGPVRAAWRVNSAGSDEEHVFIDAMSGAEVARVPLARRDRHHETFNCDGCTSSGLPGDLQWDDRCHPAGADNSCVPLPLSCVGEWPDQHCETGVFKGTSAAVDAALITTEDYLITRLGRDGWDNATTANHRMRGSSDANSVSMIFGKCNAEWRSNGMATAPAQVVLGSDRACLDVIQHEFMHGVDETSVVGPISNAVCTTAMSISEGMADVIGELVEVYSAGSPGNWVTGTACPTCGLTFFGERSLQDPTSQSTHCRLVDCGGTAIDTRPSPDTWSEYRPDCNGWWNATIIGKAGYLMGREPSEGGETHGGILVTGIGEAETSAVFYDALNEKLSGSASFTDFKNAAIQSCIDTGASSLADCFNAVRAVGLWSGDVNTGWSVRPEVGGVDLATYPLPEFGTSDRWVFYTDGEDPGRDGLLYRTRSCPVGGACSWSPETNIEPWAEGIPAASTIPGGPMVFCFRVFNPGASVYDLWCDHWNGSLNIGPDPSNPNIRDNPSLAFFNGFLYLVFRVAPTGAIKWRRLDPLTMTWSAEADVHPSASTFHSPVIASGDEDRFGGAPDSLFLLWVIGSGPNQGQIAYIPFNDATDTWDFAAGGVLQQETLTVLGPVTQFYMTNDPVGAAFFRGRLHVTATDVGLDELGSGDTLWYGSCGLPCNEPTDWTRLVQQDGGAQSGVSLDTYGAYDHYLRIWHRLASSDMIAHRLKESE